MYKYFLDTLLCRFTSAVVMPSGYYGNAADDIPSYFSELHCSGFENSLSQCRYNRGELSCPDPQRDAAVSCSGVEAVVIPGSNKILFLLNGKPIFVKSSIKFIRAIYFFFSVDTMSL